MSEVELKGWDDLMRNLDQVGARAKKNILRGMLRDSSHAVRDAIKELAPILKPGTKNPHERYPGQLRDSVIAVDVQIPESVAAGVKIRGSREQLQAVRQAGRALLKNRLKSAAGSLGKALGYGFYWRWIEYGSPHNDPAQPFVRPGWDGVKNTLLERMATYGRKRIAKLAED